MFIFLIALSDCCLSLLIYFKFMIKTNIQQTLDIDAINKNIELKFITIVNVCFDVTYY